MSTTPVNEIQQGFANLDKARERDAATASTPLLAKAFRLEHELMTTLHFISVSDWDDAIRSHEDEIEALGLSEEETAELDRYMLALGWVEIEPAA